MALTLEMDVAEPRLLRGRLVASADGTSWAMVVSSSAIWVAPGTQTAMLRPVPTREDWGYVTSGDHARLQKSAYTLTTAAAWIEQQRMVAGDYWLESLGVNEVVTTAASHSANRAFYLAAYVYGVQTQRQCILRAGWGVPASAGSVEVRLFASGDAEVWKSGALVATYDQAGKSLISGPRSGRSGQVTGQVVSWLLIPCRRRELLVVSNNDGAGFSHAFTDLDPLSTSNAITPSGQFWWYVPAAPDGSFFKASVQCAPLKFATSGSLYGSTTTLRFPPPTGTVFSALVAADSPGFGTQALTASLVVASSLAAFTPNGTLDSVRVKAAFTGDGDTTKYLYAIDASCPPVASSTSSSAFNLLPYCRSLSLSVPEQGAASLDIECSGPANMQSAGLNRPLTVGDRPVRLAAEGVDIFRGCTTGVEVIDAKTTAIGNDAATAIRWQCTDRTYEFDSLAFLHTLPYDGLTLSNALSDLAQQAGYVAGDLDITTDTFLLPYSPAVSAGDWQLLPALGDTVGQWIERLLRDYAATWLVGWAPTLSGYKWRARRPDTFSSTPAAELYRSRLDATLASVSASWVGRRVVRARTRQPLAPEANKALVVGFDPRTGTSVLSSWDDASSQDPTLAPAARPDNWRGRTHFYALVDTGAINDQATADRARDIIDARLGERRKIEEIETELIIRSSDGRPLWKGDVLRVYDKGNGSVAPTLYTDYRILALSCEFVFEGTAGAAGSVRRATYRIEAI